MNEQNIMNNEQVIERAEELVVTEIQKGFDWKTFGKVGGAATIVALAAYGVVKLVRSKKKPVEVEQAFDKEEARDEAIDVETTDVEEDKE